MRCSDYATAPYEWLQPQFCEFGTAPTRRARLLVKDEPARPSPLARTIFIHSIAFPSTLQGIAPDHLRFSVLGPALDLGFIDDARKRFQEKAAYLTYRKIKRSLEAYSDAVGWGAIVP
jgi:hypothetical protein